MQHFNEYDRYIHTPRVFGGISKSPVGHRSGGTIAGDCTIHAVRQDVLPQESDVGADWESGRLLCYLAGNAQKQKISVIVYVNTVISI